MADLTYGRLDSVSENPYLVKVFKDVELSATAGTLPHGEGRAPDEVWVAPTATVVSWAVQAKNTTSVTIDASAASTGDVFCKWYSSSDGGI